MEKKKRRKRFYLCLIIACSMMFYGCGTSGAQESSPLEGNWVAVVTEMFGVQVPVEDAVEGGFLMEVKGKGKVDLTIGSDSGSGKWAIQEDVFTLTVDGEEIEGIVGEDTITFEDMLGMGLKVIFAKEGTDAMDASLYLPEDDKAMMGEWVAESVEELLGDGPVTIFDGVDNIQDALKMKFQEDYTVAVTYKGQEMGSYPWSMAFGSCIIESEDPSFYITTEEGSITVDYSDADDYYTFVCTKVE